MLLFTVGTWLQEKTKQKNKKTKTPKNKGKKERTTIRDPSQKICGWFSAVEWQGHNCKRWLPSTQERLLFFLSQGLASCVTAKAPSPLWNLVVSDSNNTLHASHHVRLVRLKCDNKWHQRKSWNIWSSDDVSGVVLTALPVFPSILPKVG